MSTLKSMSDEELALAYIDGNNRAFDELLSRSQDKIFSYIHFVVKDPQCHHRPFQGRQEQQSRGAWHGERPVEPER